MTAGQTLLDSLGWHAALPRFFRVVQPLPPSPLVDVAPQVAAELDRIEGLGRLDGQRVGIAVGSRGIAELPALVRAVTDWIYQRGGRPVILPAMGSHGGGTAEGQQAVLAALGVTEVSMGAPVEASTATDTIGTVLGRPVYWSTTALHTDRLILINRIKPHTAFRGTRESGITKMLVVGLGKPRGAAMIHSLGLSALSESLPAFSQAILSAAPPVTGLAVIEDGVHRPCHIEAIPGPGLAEREPRLLAWAREQMATLPVKDLDVLVVDEIGKNISGDGMDPNVTGRYANPDLVSAVRIRKVVVLGLSPETEGNGNGIGLADLTTRHALGTIDWEKSYFNALTGGVTDTVRAPVALASPHDAIRAAMGAAAASSGGPGDRLLRIRNTLQLHEMIASECLADALAAVGCNVDPAPTALLSPWAQT